MAENTEKKKPIILSIYDYDNLLTDIDTYLPSKQTNTPINNTDNTDNTDNDNISTNSTLLPNFKIFDTIADTSSNLIVLPTKINIESTASHPQPTICLNMIVKNESRIIKRLLDSVVSLIDTYCICDTGSTDNTIEIIKNYFDARGINGIIFSEPFRNFGYNRTVSLQRARTTGADYLLFLDADMILEIGKGFKKSMLTEAGYQVMQRNASIQYYNLRIIHTRIDTKCVGVTHEYYDTPGAGLGKLDSDIIIINDIGDGGAKGNKYERDVMLLEQGLKDLEVAPNPGLRQRYLFYLANTYLDSGKNDKAASNYKLRIEAGGWHEEVFYAYLKLGTAYKNMGRDGDAITAWLEGYNHYPKRAESLYEIVKHYRLAGKNLLAWHFYLIAKDVAFPKDDVLFINYGVYEYLLDYEASIVVYYVPVEKRAGISPSNLINKLLQHPRSCEYWGNLLSNYKFYYPRMRDLASCRIIDYTAKKRMTIGGNDYTMTTSSPCIFQWDGKWFMNIRWVNYQINTSNGGYSYDHNKIITANEQIELDSEWQIVARRMFDTCYIENDQYQGIEDCKVHIGADGVPRFMGTMWHGRLCIGYGVYPVEDPSAKELEYVACKSPVGAGCEKNWVMIGDQVIYQWHPLVLGHMDRDGKQWRFVEELRADTHWLFKDVRGSSNAWWRADTQEWWLIVHLVEHGNPRMYYHMLVVLDSGKKIKKWSKIFKFGEDKIEYCLGLAIEDGKLIMSYSGWDRSAKLGMWSLEEVEREMFV